MINNHFKQIAFSNFLEEIEIKELTKNFLPKFFNDEERLKNSQKIIRPYRIILSNMPENTWVYFNNDISPIVLTKNFDWDVKNIGLFNEMYFVFNKSFSEIQNDFNTLKPVLTAFYEE